MNATIYDVTGQQFAKLLCRCLCISCEPITDDEFMLSAILLGFIRSNKILTGEAEVIFTRGLQLDVVALKPLWKAWTDVLLWI